MAHIPSLKEIEKCDAVLILGEDITNTAPMMALSVRQCIRNKSIGIASKMGIPEWNDSAVRQLNHEVKSPLFIASPSQPNSMMWLRKHGMPLRMI